MFPISKVIQPLEYYRSHINEGKRPDGRSLSEFREMNLNINSISHADGSALVKLGNSTVLCGIKAELAEPKVDASSTGYVVPNIDLSPLCSPQFRSGPPPDQAQVYSQFLLNVIKSSGCLNLEDLVIKDKKLVWCLYADLTCLDYDGNILDASITAMISALQNLTLPKVEVEDDEIKVDVKSRSSLTLSCLPVASSFGIFEDVIIADPTNEEENLISGQFTIVSSDSGSICLIYKPGGAAISEEQLYTCLGKARTRTKDVSAMLNAAKDAL